MFNVNLRNVTLITLFTLGIPNLALAKEIENYEDYKLYCSDAAYQYDVASPNCDILQPLYKEQIQQDLNQQSEKKSIFRRNTRPNNIEGYAGISLGAFFPDDEIGNTGFGGSVFAGAKWNQYIGTDLEFIYLFGGTEFDSLDYSVLGVSLNPRFFIPLSNNDLGDTATIFISPGLGFSTLEVNVDDLGISFEDETRLTWQIKAGLSVPFQKKFKGFFQVRYADQFEENTTSFFGTEVGVSVDF